MNKVMIVDDNAAVRRMLYHALHGWDFDLVLAADGETALALARAEKPDLMILDLRMPGRDGYEVCDALRSEETTRGIRVLMLTGEGDEEAALTAGASAFLAKPFNLLELGKRVGALLARAS